MGDLRLDERGAWLHERVVETGSLTLKTLGGGRSGEIAINRYLGNPRIAPQAILEPHVLRTRSAVQGLDLIVAQDTTEVNFKGRSARRKGLGPAGDGESPGFFIHPQIAIDAASEAVLGVAGAEIWTRPQEKAADRRARELKDKESRRWLTGMERAASTLGGAALSLTVVGDRESDIYGVFARRPVGVDLIVRAAQNRALEEGGLLKSAGEDWAELARQRIEVPARRAGEKGGAQPARIATVAIKAGRIAILAPRNGLKKEDTAASVELSLVIVREVDCPAGCEGIEWRLLTTRPARTEAEARDVIRRYRMRWRIEEVFRTLKTDGLDLEASQVTTAGRLLNLAAFGLVAAVRIVQLVDARDGSTRPATDVIAEEAIEAVAAVGDSLDGRTPRQQNPWEKGSLAWLAWICARLGGWNCYYRPPGPKTMANGWRRLAERLEGFTIAQSQPLARERWHV